MIYKKQKLRESSSSPDEDVSQTASKKKRQNSLRIDTDTDESRRSAEGLTSDSEGDSDSAKMNQNISMSKQRRTNAVDSDSTSEEGTSIEEDPNTTSRAASERAQVMADKRQAKRDLLKQLKANRGRLEDSGLDALGQSGRTPFYTCIVGAQTMLAGKSGLEVKTLEQCTEWTTGIVC